MIDTNQVESISGDPSSSSSSSPSSTQKPERIFFACDEPERLTYEDEGEAIMYYLDQIDPKDLPETIEVTEYHQMKVTPPWWMVDNITANLIETLDEEYAYENHTQTDEVVRQITALANTFVEAATKLYDGSMYEPFGKPKIVNVMEWVKDNEPEWLTP